jgi:hypothetical protein
VESPKDIVLYNLLKTQASLSEDIERPLVGIVKHTDGRAEGDRLVGFTPFSTYEFIIDGRRLYRVMTQFITIKYEYQGNEEEYNPSWAKSSGGVNKGS